MPGQNARRTGRLRPDKTSAWSSLATPEGHRRSVSTRPWSFGHCMDLLLVAAESK